MVIMVARGFVGGDHIHMPHYKVHGSGAQLLSFGVARSFVGGADHIHMPHSTWFRGAIPIII